MGLSNSQPQRNRKSTSSIRRQSSELMEISRKIDEKECTFIAMQAEIEKAITEHNIASMNCLAAEISAHIVDLGQLKKVNLPSGERGRSQRILYNYEISLAKLKSILNSDTRVVRRPSSPENAQYTVDPDIVSDLIRFDNSDSRRFAYSQNRESTSSLPANRMSPDHVQLSRNNSLYSKEPKNVEDLFRSVECEFDVLKDQSERPIGDINEYYQMDKGVFYLQVQVKNVDVPQGSTLNDRKFDLLKRLAEFRDLLDQKSGELEEQTEITKEVNTLELLVDSALESELGKLETRTLLLQETIEKRTWDQHFIRKKLDLLKRLAKVMERIAYSASPAASLRYSVEHLYGNMNSLQEELNNIRVREEIETIESIDRVLEEQPEHTEETENYDEEIYGNVEIIRQNLNGEVTPRVRRTPSNPSQRGTVYANVDVVRQNSVRETDNSFSELAQELVNKPPLPLPRNYDDKIINDLSKHWKRLNEILDSERVSETDKLELAEIQKHAEVAKNLFERKIKRIIEKSVIVL